MTTVQEALAAMKEAAGRIEYLREVNEDLVRCLNFYIANVPAVRSRPLGSPLSDARVAQEAHIQAEDYAKDAVAKALA